jgi:phage shock protein E
MNLAVESSLSSWKGQSMKQLFSSFGAAITLLLLIATTVTAQLDAITDLNADELRQLREQVAEVLVVDVRTAQEFAGGHIRGAINISSPASDQFRMLAGMLPADKQIPLVFYCRGYN